MNLLRNVEAMLMLGFGALCAAAWSGQAPAAASTARPAQGAAAAAPPMVVVITAKRLTAAEKRAFDLQKQS